MQHRRFAYLHKNDRQRLGLLQALDMKNARGHLGRDFMIQETWLSDDEEESVGFDSERRREIVASVFHELVIPKEPEPQHVLQSRKKEKAKSQSSKTGNDGDACLLEIIQKLESRVRDLERVIFAEVLRVEKPIATRNPWAKQ
jgi:hypothetical protein